MHFREATIADIPHLSHVRLSVQENRLSDPSRISAADYADYLAVRGNGWLCEMNSIVTGFAIADLVDNNVWALFVLPEYQRLGIGRQLQDFMLEWYFSQGKETIWLTTSSETTAVQFYRRTGWRQTGIKHGELLFEMTAHEWRQLRLSNLHH